MATYGSNTTIKMESSIIQEVGNSALGDNLSYTVPSGCFLQFSLYPISGAGSGAVRVGGSVAFSTASTTPIHGLILGPGGVIDGAGTGTGGTNRTCRLVGVLFKNTP